MVRLLLMVSFVLFAAGGTFAQAVPVVTSVVPLPVEANPRLYPSPDGTLVAYQRAVPAADQTEYSLCLLETTAGSAPVCSLIAQQPPRGFEPDPQAVDMALAWSPDGQQIAVTGQPLLGQEDTDLLVYNRALAEWSNLSDDAYAGALNEQSRLERHPAWSPDGATLAVVQTPAASDDETTASIALFDSVAGARRLVALPAAIADAHAITGLDWSPDGHTLALTVFAPGGASSANGIWLLDTTDGTSRLLVDSRTVQDSFGFIYANQTLNVLGAPQWSPDGAYLLVWAGNADQTPASIWGFVVTVADALLIPFNLPFLSTDLLGERSLRPLQAAWSPDSTKLLVLVPGHDGSLDDLPLDPSADGATASLYLVDPCGCYFAIFVGNLPLTASVGLFTAEWSADDLAVIDGYALHFAAE